jgi:N-acetylglucosamine-6-phosphate deacetylase
MRRALVNARVFDGDTVHEDRAVLVAGDRVEALLPAAQLPAGCPVDDLGGRRLVPGYVDLQVNGGGDVLFNDSPTVEGIRRIAAAHCRLGTTAFLPTLISDDFDTMRAAIAAVAGAIDAGVPGVLGIHLEGPFLNPARRGVHDAVHFRELDDEALAVLTALPRGVTLVTVAPERTDPATIRALRAQGVHVWAGHSDADFAAVRAALDAGLEGFTHLFNAMSPLQGRAPGVVGAALDDADSFCGVIADGHHVHEASLRIALAAKPRGRICLVSDAMPTVGGDRDGFKLNGEQIYSRGGRCTTAGGTLAGSDIALAAAVRYATRKLGVDWPEAVRMASLYPARALGLDGELGRIAPGYRAAFCLLDDDLGVLRSWCAGA